MSISELTGISVAMFTTARGGSPDFIRTIDNYESYTHRSDAFGGFLDASFSIKVNLAELSEWYANGIGRHIEVRDNSGAIVWEGFINELTINYSSRKITIGPATAIANKVRVMYTPVYTAFNPPVKGNQTFTAYYQDTVSQGKYGIFEKTINAGECTDANAITVANVWLIENAYPAKNETLSIGQSGPASVEVRCIGYINAFLNYSYETLASGTTTHDSKIKSIISADPNLFLAFDFTYIQTNTLSLEANTPPGRSNLDIIRSIVSDGDSSYNRWIFGVYAGRRVHYEGITATDPFYVYSLSDGVKSLALFSGPLVSPWQILPGKYLRYDDFTLGKIAGTIKADPNIIFIESVTYNAPFGLTLNGGRVSTVEQRLARLGLGGA